MTNNADSWASIPAVKQDYEGRSGMNGESALLTCITIHSLIITLSPINYSMSATQKRLAISIKEQGWQQYLHSGFPLEESKQFYIRTDQDMSFQKKQQARTEFNFLNTRKSIIATATQHSHEHPHSHEDIYLNIPMSPVFNSFDNQQSLKSFNKKLQQCLKQREIDRALEGQSGNAKGNQPGESPQRARKSFRKRILVIEDKDKTKSDCFLEGTAKRRKFSHNLSAETKQNFPNNKSICQIPPLNEEQRESDCTDYYERLITSESSKVLLERILKRRREEKKVEEESSRRFVKCSLNKRVFNKLCQKGGKIDDSLLDEPHENAHASPEQKKKSHIFKFFDEKRTSYQPTPILSPQKPAQRAEALQGSLRKVLRPIAQQQQEREQLGPWKQESHLMSFQI